MSGSTSPPGSKLSISGSGLRNPPERGKGKKKRKREKEKKKRKKKRRERKGKKKGKKKKKKKKKVNFKELQLIDAKTKCITIVTTRDKYINSNYRTSKTAFQIMKKPLYKWIHLPSVGIVKIPIPIRIRSPRFSKLVKSADVCF